MRNETTIAIPIPKRLVERFLQRLRDAGYSDDESRRMFAAEVWRLHSAGYSDSDVKQVISLAYPAAIPSEASKRGRGRETKWTATHHHQFLMEVYAETGAQTFGEATLQAKGKISAICRNLAEREPWRTLAIPTKRSDEPWKVLRDRFTLLCKARCVVGLNKATGELAFETAPKSRRRGGKYKS